MSDITVIIPTSPISSHPSTRIIEEVVVSAKKQLPDSPILITCDGTEDVNGEYYRYTDNVVSLWHGKERVFRGPLLARLHQSGMLVRTLPEVSSPLILYLEHDWALLPNVPWKELSDLILSGKFNYIKLHANPRISPFHEHMMEKRVICQNGVVYDRYQDNQPGVPIPLILTRQWSQNPHLASTQFYRDKILPLCVGRCDFIENLAHGVVGNAPWEEYRCAIYNPTEGDMMRVRHLDGRGSK